METGNRVERARSTTAIATHGDNDRTVMSFGRARVEGSGFWILLAARVRCAARRRSVLRGRCAEGSCDPVDALRGGELGLLSFDGPAAAHPCCPVGIGQAWSVADDIGPREARSITTIASLAPIRSPQNRCRRRLRSPEQRCAKVGWQPLLANELHLGAALSGGWPACCRGG